MASILHSHHQRLVALDTDKYKNIITESLHYMVQQRRIDLDDFIVMNNHFYLIWQRRKSDIRIVDFVGENTNKGVRIKRPIPKNEKRLSLLITFFADWTGLEPATSAVTGRHSNQLNYQSFSQNFQKCLTTPLFFGMAKIREIKI